MPSRNVTLPESRLLSMIAGAFRYGAEQERVGEIGDTERAYAASEHHALRMVEEFEAAGHIAVEGTREPAEAPYEIRRNDDGTVADPMTWDRGDPLEDAIWRLCDYLQADLDWNLTDAGNGGIPAPDELFPSAVRKIMGPLMGDGLRRARIEALRAELERLTAPEQGGKP